MSVSETNNGDQCFAAGKQWTTTFEQSNQILPSNCLDFKIKFLKRSSKVTELLPQVAVKGVSKQAAYDACSLRMNVQEKN